MGVTTMLTTVEVPTRPSLLDRARDPADQEAWADFVGYYEGLIRHWCRGLQDADRDDVTQAILCRLFKTLPEFRYNPSNGRFRGWLRTISRHAIVDHVRERQRHPGGCGSGDTRVHEQLQGAPAAGDTSIEEPVGEPTGQEERLQRALDAARERVRQRVEPKTWLAYWLTTVEGQPTVEVAQQLGIKKGTVLVYKCRVAKMIESEGQGRSGCGGAAHAPGELVRCVIPRKSFGAISRSFGATFMRSWTRQNGARSRPIFKTASCVLERWRR